MEFAQLDDWLDGINTNIASSTGSAANVPRVIVVQVVRSVVRDFLKRSEVWVYHPKNIVNQGDKRIVIIPRETYICKVWPIHCRSYLNEGLALLHPNIIDVSSLNCDVSNDDLKDIKVSLSVTQASLECPMFIYDRYYEGILSGSLARLQSMPGKAWSETNMVGYHEAIFEAAVLDAKSDVANSFNIKKQNTSIPPTFL